MKFVSFRKDGRMSWGSVMNDRVVELTALAPGIQHALAHGRLPKTHKDFPADAPRHALTGIELLPPVPDTDRIFCVGTNYAAHQAEMGPTRTQQPVIFVRFAASVVGHEQALMLPPESGDFDFEGELAVIIGKAGRRISEADALRHVAGYACFMDGTLRNWQMHTHQYTPGKNFDRSGAFGPWMMSADAAGDPNGGLRLHTRLNGQLMQEATTDQMIFPVPALIAYLSTFTALQPGDVIATGTPGGVGFKRNPPVYMRTGDRIEVEIDKIGLLANTVRNEA